MIHLVGTQALAESPTVGSTRPDSRPNVVLVSIDSLRAVQLGAYGYPRNTSPNIDALASESMVFETAYAQASWTLASHASVFTGIDPIAHGVTEKRGRLDPAHTTVAELLQTAGYATAAWVGRGEHSFVGARRGFAQGFDRYEHAPHGERAREAIRFDISRRKGKQDRDIPIGEGENEISSVLRFIANRTSEPFFLFIHLDDVHSQATGRPYDSPPPFQDRFCPGTVDDYTGCTADEKLCGTRRLQHIRRGLTPPPSKQDLETIVCLYDGAVAFADHQIGRLVEGLRSARILDRTLFILTADHGEALMEHGELSHFSVYDEVARVPLIVRWPGTRAAGRNHEVVELVDLFPTILEAAGIATPPFLQGQSLAGDKSLADGASNQTAITMGTASPPQFQWRRGDAKLVVRPVNRKEAEAKRADEELFDLGSDPLEMNNRSASDPNAMRELHRELEERKAISERINRNRNAGLKSTIDLPQEELELLKALGYVE